MNNARKQSRTAGPPCTCELVGSGCAACWPRYHTNGSMPYGEHKERLEQVEIDNAKRQTGYYSGR